MWEFARPWCESQKSGSAWANTSRAGLMWESENLQSEEEKGRENSQQRYVGRKGRMGTDDEKKHQMAGKVAGKVR